MKNKVNSNLICEHHITEQVNKHEMNIYRIVQTHTAVFMALFPGQSGWAGTRRDIHPLTPETCCGRLSSS